MRYISIFSGIEAATVAWKPLGWEAVAFAEIDKFPSAVLAARFPEVSNLGDVTKIDWRSYRGTVDVVVGGSPCQSFSVAGKREGLSGASALMWEYIRCVQDVMPKWLCWENVCGSLTVEKGRAFAQLLSTLHECGYGLAWRVLDAQFVRVPVWDGNGRIARWVGPVAQRRKRVYLVGHLGDMRACEVLFESESLRWDNPSSREARKMFAGAAGRGFAHDSARVQLTAPRFVAHSAGFKFHQGSQSRSIGYKEEQAPTLTADWHNPAVITQHGEDFARTLTMRHDSSPCVDRGSNVVFVETAENNGVTISDGTRWVVRRLTPLECERLQGFPDNWTRISWRGKPEDECPDGPRYKAIGNSMAVPVMRWIGTRIEAANGKG